MFVRTLFSEKYNAICSQRNRNMKHSDIKKNGFYVCNKQIYTSFFKAPFPQISKLTDQILYRSFQIFFSGWAGLGLGPILHGNNYVGSTNTLCNHCASYTFHCAEPPSHITIRACLHKDQNFCPWPPPLWSCTFLILNLFLTH